MADHTVQVVLTFPVTFDDELRESLDIEEGTAVEESEALKAAMKDPGSVDWQSLIDVVDSKSLRVEVNRV